MEFVSDEHTNRNLMIRGVRTGAAPSAADLADYDELVAEWHVVPALAERIADDVRDARVHVRA